MEMIRAVLGWTTVINIAILVLSTIAVICMRGFISKFHGRLFGLDEKDLGRAYFQYIAQYKIAIIVLNIAPYIALRILS
ncbi:DUF6868 family protein [Biformimicrobium ophioploci]|nr:hypothetical protein [Microbulbifer sp. NKW57]